MREWRETVELKCFWSLLLLLVLVFVAACEPSPPLRASEAWVRVSPPSHRVTAGFLTLHNQSASDIAVVAASSPVAERVEVHAHLHEGGVMRMREVERLEIAAGTSLSLKPGGYHLMLFGVHEALQSGQQYPLTLKTEAGLSITVPMLAVMPGER